MSDDSRQEPAASGHRPPDAARPAFPAHESFGPPFPETPAASPSIPTPAQFGYGAPPGQMPGTPPGAHFAFAGPPGYTTPPIYGYAVPPQALYGPPGMFSAPPRPLSLGEAFRQLPRQYWNVLTHPKAATFAWEQGKAAWNIIWLQLLILALVESLVVLALFFLEFFLIQLILPSNAVSFVSQALPITAMVVVLFCITLVPISFFFGSGILHLVARAFGGEGSFLQYAYCYALITVPIGMLSLALSVIPCIGSIASLGGSVYSIVLLIYMTMGVHRLSGGKASASVLIPIGIGILLVVGAYVAYIVWVFSLISTLPATR